MLTIHEENWNTISFILVLRMPDGAASWNYRQTTIDQGAIFAVSYAEQYYHSLADRRFYAQPCFLW